MTVKIVTLGCRINTYESAVMKNLAEDLTDTIIVNTCAVTGEAERQCRQTIRKLRRENPNATIIVTGCAVQLHPEEYAAMPEIDRVLGNRDKMLAQSFMRDHKRIEVSAMDSNANPETALEGFEGRTRAFLQVQQGCDHACTFCIVPKARGKNHSIAEATVINQTRKLVDAGYKEIVLAGIDITSYITANGRLGDLVASILQQVPDLARLRLSSLDPDGVDDTLIAQFADKRLMPNVHLSIQAGDDMILKRMARRHLRQDVIDLCHKLRQVRPDIVIGSDFIAGFPTETDAMFNQTMNLVEQCNITHLHVFPYSARTGTPAALMPQVPMEVRKERAKTLRLKGEELMAKYLNAQIGTTASVLIERQGRGYNEHYTEVTIDESTITGQIVDVTIVGVKGNELIGVRK